jgi:protein O-mannosyl-transferase
VKRISATAVSAGTLALAALAAFWPVVRNGFVNWDDPTVLVGNTHLGSAGAVSWAFSTTLIGHYQPLSWLAWSAVTSLFGLSPVAFHALGLALHVANGLVVFALTLRLVGTTSLGPRQRRAAAWLAAALFLLHPIAVEAVAWASAFPYLLSSFALLLSFLAYVNGRRWISLVCYAASLLARATALGYPLILLVADVYPLDRRRRTSAGRLLIEKAPFAALAAAAAAAEWQARDVATLQDIGIVPRVTLAATAPLLYLWRLLWPVRLSPLDPLPITPAIAWLPLIVGLTGVIAATALAWRARARWPLVISAWIVYLILLAPVSGLAPTGLQATADRYMYVPGAVLAIAIGVAVGSGLPNRGAAAAAAVMIAAVAACGVLTWKQTHYWNSSVTLWTRAAELDPGNDVATYNLAVALADAGRADDAIGWYERTLVLVPDHDLARRNRDLLRAADAERQADRLAAAGHAADASAAYARALALDPKRPHARAARGMLLMARGDFREAVVELRLAIDGGVTDAEVANALGFALAQTGDAAAAAQVLGRAVAAHPDNVNLKHNLARLLATTPDARVRDGARALRLALEVCDRTANRDPRALDTLSAAYAASGQFDMARATASRAEARAREVGDGATAAEIAAHARGYRR